MFCVLSQNNPHLLENNVGILKQIVQGTQNGIEILVGQVVLSYGSKYCMSRNFREFGSDRHFASFCFCDFPKGIA